MKNKALDNCIEPAKAYADCCSGRTVSVVWRCRGKLESYNQCLRQQCVAFAACSFVFFFFLLLTHTLRSTQPSVLEALKDEWLATRILPPVKYRAPPPSSH